MTLAKARKDGEGEKHRQLQSVMRFTQTQKASASSITSPLHLNHTSALVFSCKFAAYFQNTFSWEHLWTAASVPSLVVLSPVHHAEQLYWNHTSAWVFSRKFVAYFQNTAGRLLLIRDNCSKSWASRLLIFQWQHEKLSYLVFLGPDSLSISPWFSERKGKIKQILVMCKRKSSNF